MKYSSSIVFGFLNVIFVIMTLYSDIKRILRVTDVHCAVLKFMFVIHVNICAKDLFLLVKNIHKMHFH